MARNPNYSISGSMITWVLTSILSQHIYTNSEKDWFIELIQSKIYWYDLLVNEHDLFDTKKIIKNELLELKNAVTESLEKRFIYFIFSRKKIRFDIKKQPKITLLSRKLKVFLLIGRDNKKVAVSLPLRQLNNQPVKATVSEKFITLDISEDDKISMSIHDFLLNFNINLGMHSKIQYVGYTKNPETRPTNGAHSGLSGILHNVPNNDNDILISFNLFKVTSKGTDFKSNTNFLIANSMIDEINVDLEGFIIEKCFILYFNSNNQKANKINERQELTNNLIKLKQENKIKSIQLHYEVDDPSEYFILYSDKVSPSIQHLFTIKEENNEVVINDGSALYSKSYNI